jgi:hypothetical protein
VHGARKLSLYPYRIHNLFLCLSIIMGLSVHRAAVLEKTLTPSQLSPPKAIRLVHAKIPFVQPTGGACRRDRSPAKAFQARQACTHRGRRSWPRRLIEGDDWRFGALFDRSLSYPRGCVQDVQRQARRLRATRWVNRPRARMPLTTRTLSDM